MSITVAELLARLALDSRDFSGGLRRAEGDTDGFASRAGSKFAAFGKVAVAGLAVAGAAAVGFGIKAVSLASDVNESLSKVMTVFGKSGAEIDKWSKQTATSIGLPRGAALDAAGSFGNMFDQLGIGAKESAKMSTGIVNLAADFASFHNADISEVIDAQSAAFRGEYDSLQRFLPLINAAAVEQKALAMTGKTATSELNQQEKALAVHALMLEGAGDAQGDFARTSDSLANRLRIVKAKAEDFAVGVGNVLLPIVLKAFDVFEKVGKFLQVFLAPVFKEIKGGIVAFAAAWKYADGEVTSSGFPGLMERIAGFIVTTVVPALDVVRRGIGAFAEALGGAGASTAPGFIGAMSKIGDFFHGTLIPIIKTVIGWIGDLFGAFSSGEGEAGHFASKIGETFSALVGIIRPALDAVIAAIRLAFKIVVDLWDTVGVHLFNGVKTTLQGVLEVFRGVFNAIKGVFDVFAGIFTGDWSRVWKGLKAIVDGIWDAIVGVVRNALMIIPKLFMAAGGLIAEAARAMWDGLISTFKSVLNLIIDAWNRLDFGIDIQIPDWVPGIGGKGFKINDIIPDLPRFHDGGIVPGPRGAEVPIMAQAGERVIAAGESAGGMVVNVYVQGDTDPDGAAARIAEKLRNYGNKTGGLRFT